MDYDQRMKLSDEFEVKLKDNDFTVVHVATLPNRDQTVSITDSAEFLYLLKKLGSNTIVFRSLLYRSDFGIIYNNYFFILDYSKELEKDYKTLESL